VLWLLAVEGNDWSVQLRPPVSNKVILWTWWLSELTYSLPTLTHSLSLSLDPGPGHAIESTPFVSLLEFESEKSEIQWGVLSVTLLCKHGIQQIVDPEPDVTPIFWARVQRSTSSLNFFLEGYKSILYISRSKYIGNACNYTKIPYVTVFPIHAFHFMWYLVSTNSHTKKK
jgi:hypothetical protein